jgi:para-aminobenzoate synthetase component 1
MSIFMRQTAVFEITDPEHLKRQLLHWADTRDVAVYLDSNDYPAIKHDAWECLVAAGAHDVVTAPAGTAFDTLRIFYEDKKDWLFGTLAYDLKNEVERLTSLHPDGIGFPDLYFFQPEIVAGIRNNRLEIFSLGQSPEAIGAEIRQTRYDPAPVGDMPVIPVPRMPKPEYLDTVAAIRAHIIEGDLYEMNLCQEFYAENVQIDPVSVFHRLNAIGRAPFSTFLKYDQRYLLSASPERFLQKTGDSLLSQPIKGTRRRGKTLAEDEAARRELAASVKDRAENVMIVDLVRNDLARSCRPGSVQVPELFGIHTFQTVHQMISSVTGRLRPDVDPVTAIERAFPMGSMTGAPKVMAMELIERYERTRRGLYSGAVGYFTPEGDFDFNVVIRSILYQARTGYLCFLVGGAIVYDSVPEQEYEECMLKAEAMLRALSE